jgi:hypothetical protein
MEAAAGYCWPYKKNWRFRLKAALTSGAVIVKIITRRWLIF